MMIQKYDLNFVIQSLLKTKDILGRFDRYGSVLKTFITN